MIIGFLGKGGSGKTTLATLFIKHLLSEGRNVLAVDADHNMDLTDNFGQESLPNYIGQAYSDILTYLNINSPRSVLEKDLENYFSMSPMDSVTELYSIPLQEKLRLMVVGPHTEAMMYGSGSSHILVQPLRIYLPYLKLKKNEAVVVDEKAGADGVGTGITVGFTTAVVVAEATRHGLKAAKQISKMLKFYNTPHVFVLNKVRDPAFEEEATKELGDKPIISIPFNPDLAYGDSSAYKNLISTLCHKLETIEDTREQRAKARLEKLEEYESRE